MLHDLTTLHVSTVLEINVFGFFLPNIYLQLSVYCVKYVMAINGKKRRYLV